MSSVGQRKTLRGFKINSIFRDSKQKEIKGSHSYQTPLTAIRKLKLYSVETWKIDRSRFSNQWSLSSCSGGYRCRNTEQSHKQSDTDKWESAMLLGQALAARERGAFCVASSVVPSRDYNHLKVARKLANYCLRSGDHCMVTECWEQNFVTRF